MDISCNVSLLQSKVSIAKVADLLEANKVLRRARKDPEVGIFHFRPVRGPTSAIGWSDASLNNRANKKSIGGHMIGLANEKNLTCRLLERDTDYMVVTPTQEDWQQ